MTKSQWEGYLSGDFVPDSEDPCDWGSPPEIEFPCWLPPSDFRSSCPSPVSGEASVGLPSTEGTSGDGFAPDSPLATVSHVPRRTIYRRPSKKHKKLAENARVTPPQSMCVFSKNGCSITHRRPFPCLRSICRFYFGPKPTHGPPRASEFDNGFLDLPSLRLAVFAILKKELNNGVPFSIT